MFHPLPPGSGEKFEQMFRFSGEGCFTAALFTSSSRIRFHFLMDWREQFYQLNCYLGEGKSEILVPMKHDELGKECVCHETTLKLCLSDTKIRSASLLEQ